MDNKIFDFSVIDLDDNASATVEDSTPVKPPREILNDLVVSSQAITAMLITKEGHNVAEAGNTTNLNTTAIAALVAGMFTATREVARLVGEKQFSILLQQGEKRHIHISLVTGSTMMIVVFEDYQRIGRVRHEARKAGELLAKHLQQDARRNANGEAAPDLSMANFKEYALDIIDRIFEIK